MMRPNHAEDGKEWKQQQTHIIINELLLSSSDKIANIATVTQHESKSF